VNAAWAERYLDMAPQAAAPVGAPLRAGGDEDRGVVLVRETGQGRFQQEVTAGAHRLLADEPNDVGGTDSGPNPYDLLLAALGACTAMTLRLYAERKALRLDRVAVRLRHAKVHAADCENCESRDGRVDRIERGIVLEGELDAQQRARLLEIADKCPIHRTLTSGVDIVTSELSAPP
jgi:uncharacterized OsmC-like protein